MVLIILTLININIPYKILRLKTTFVRKIILTQQQRVKVVQNQQERMTKGKEEEKNRRWAFLEEDGQATVRAWYNKQTTDRKISPSWSSSSVSSKCLAKCSTSATLVVLNDDDDVGECTLITSTSIRQH